MRLNFQLITKFKASLEWKLPFQKGTKSSNGISPRITSVTFRPVRALSLW
jgi:hypothetical protein